MGGVDGFFGGVDGFAAGLDTGFDAGFDGEKDFVGDTELPFRADFGGWLFCCCCFILFLIA